MREEPATRSDHSNDSRSEDESTGQPTPPRGIKVLRPDSGGIFELSAPVDVSNVMVVCPTCNRATRVGYEFRDSKDGRVKVRVCKRADCGEVLDR